MRSHPAPQHMRPPGPIENTEGASTSSRKIAPARVNVEEEALLSLGDSWGLKASLPSIYCYPRPLWLSLSEQPLTSVAADVTDLQTARRTQWGRSNPMHFPPWSLNPPLGEGSSSLHPEPGLSLIPQSHLLPASPRNPARPSGNLVEQLWIFFGLKSVPV